MKDYNKWATTFTSSSFDKRFIPIQFIFHFSLYSNASCFTKPVVLHCSLHPIFVIFQCSLSFNSAFIPMQFALWCRRFFHLSCLPFEIIFQCRLSSNTIILFICPNPCLTAWSKCTLGLQYILKHLLLIFFLLHIATASFCHFMSLYLILH